LKSSVGVLGMDSVDKRGPLKPAPFCRRDVKVEDGHTMGLCAEATRWDA